MTGNQWKLNSKCSVSVASQYTIFLFFYKPVYKLIKFKLELFSIGMLYVGKSTIHNMQCSQHPWWVCRTLASYTAPDVPGSILGREKKVLLLVFTGPTQTPEDFEELLNVLTISAVATLMLWCPPKLWQRLNIYH